MNDDQFIRFSCLLLKVLSFSGNFRELSGLPRAIFKQLIRYCSPYKPHKLVQSHNIAGMGGIATYMEKEPKLYELLYIIPNKYTENEIPTAVKAIDALIEKEGGKITKGVNYGKRRLAYPIKHNHHGYYILNHIEAVPSVIPKLNGKLRLQDEILRHLITVALPKGAVPEEADLTQKLQAETTPAPKQERAEKPESKKKATIADSAASATEKEKMKKGTKFDIEKELGVTASEAEKALEEKKVEEVKAESVDLAELDKKLEEIMGDIDAAEADKK